MNIAIEKQKIKEQIDRINDESIIMSIKKFLGIVKEQNHHSLTKEELVERALESEKAISEMKFVSIDDLEKEMKNW
ncbi:MAG: hypothetical protein ABIT08_08995 [Bacteroidia bacterium]